ncbi:MAG: hypothetical protein M3157_03480 [Actinomycetota bacterium]|nr:hypothetical protein [Actinomycetota bacterium]
MKKPGEYPYLTVGENPAEGGSHRLHNGRPPYGELGREIGFRDLPEGCQALVRNVYVGLWGL